MEQHIAAVAALLLVLLFQQDAYHMAGNPLLMPYSRNGVP
jgi:hypothetical protein